MNNMEFNKIFAAILVAGIVASLSGFISRETLEPAELEKAAVPIAGDASAGSGGAAAAPQMPEPILAMIASADATKGETISRACAACHNFDKGGPNQTGPNLWGVVGRPKGSHEGFSYSDDMKKKGGNWTYEDLNHFLWKPKSFVAGTKMTFIGLSKGEDRAALIAWLRTKSDSPHALPTAAEIAQEKSDLTPKAAEAPAGDKAAAATGDQAAPAAADKAEAGAAAPASPANNKEMAPAEDHNH
jgi:cytochrome c